MHRQATEANVHGVSWWLPGRPLREAPTPAWHRWDGAPGLPATRAWIDVSDVVSGQHPVFGERVWVLDTGRDADGRLIDGGPKLVALCPLTQSVVDAWYFDPRRELTASSRLRSLRLDDSQRYALVQDTGRRAVIVIDLHARRSHPVLQGLVPAEATATLEDTPDALTIRLPGGSSVRRIPLALLLDRGLSDEVRMFAAEDSAADRLPASPEDRPSRALTSLEARALNLAARWCRVAVWQGGGARPAWTRLADESARLHAEAVAEAWRSTWRQP